MKAIQKELGEIDEGKDELSSLSKAITDAKMPKIAKEKCLSELKKLKSMSPMSAEATVVRNYLDWMTELPWSNKSKINTDLNNAQKILDEDHYGLEKVKERIIEFLAVQKNTNNERTNFMLSRSTRSREKPLWVNRLLKPLIENLLEYL